MNIPSRVPHQNHGIKILIAFFGTLCVTRGYGGDIVPGILYRLKQPDKSYSEFKMTLHSNSSPFREQIDKILLFSLIEILLFLNTYSTQYRALLSGILYRLINLTIVRADLERAQSC